MQKLRTGMILLLCAALFFASFGCSKQDTQDVAPDAQPSPTEAAQALSANDVVLTVGNVPVYALTYRYQLEARYNGIVKNNLYDRDTYLAYVVNPSIYYPYPYYDTRTEEGMTALCEGVLQELALQAAAIYAAGQKGYTYTVTDKSYILEAQESAVDSLEEAAELYGSVEAFYAETGLDESTYVRMFTESREASLCFSKLLEDYCANNEIDEETLQAGYARIVKETFVDRYTDGMYSQYLYYYITGARSYPSLYIPDDAIFVRLFVHTAPTESQVETFTKMANEDFNTLYNSEFNEFTAQGTVGDLAVAPKDELVTGLYEAAKDVAVGSIGSMTLESDGKTMFYLFLRTEGETGMVSIDRYPGVREMIVNQLNGTFCMDTLRAVVSDSSIAKRNETLFSTIRPEN